ncbi:MAG: segregation/condensation protein A [Polyangiaceae bacterium]|nr:segregation/condensation protein A [Polyangiaceae bacterium]
MSAKPAKQEDTPPPPVDAEGELSATQAPTPAKDGDVDLSLEDSGGEDHAASDGPQGAGQELQDASHNVNPSSAAEASSSEQRKVSQELASEYEKEVPEGAYRVNLPAFDGPLDLLLHLIQQHELNIRDIPIGFISTKYVEYITVMQELNIDLASEYLVMAATLAHIKSKTLLPVEPKGQDDEDEEESDPRSELVRRLLEYQKYKTAAQQLGDSPVLGRDVFLRGAPAPQVDGPAPLAQTDVFKLFDAFQRILTKVKQSEDHKIGVDQISISERILQLTDRLKGLGRVKFPHLFGDNASRTDIVVTFLALLEMTRLRMLQVIQEEPLAPIEVELTLMDEHADVLNQDFGEVDPLTALARGDVENSVVSPTPIEKEEFPQASGDLKVNEAPEETLHQEAASEKKDRPASDSLSSSDSTSEKLTN